LPKGQGSNSKKGDRMKEKLECKRFNTYVLLMDDEIREELHMKLAPCSVEEFLNKYKERHFKKFGEEFKLN